MRIIKNRRIIESAWRLDRADDGAGDDGGGDGAGTAAGCDRLILPLARWRELRAALSGKRIGVLLRPEDPVDAIADGLAGIELVALDFGSFTEGRGYTQAVELRRQHRFRGEIRALGAHRDNLPLMERCGIDAYQLADGEDIEAALAAFDEITAYYPLSQPAPVGAE